MACTRFAVTEANGEFACVHADIPEPGPEQVVIEVKACGVCHSDTLTKGGHMPGIVFPRAPGHEVTGVVSKVGAGPRAATWKAGDRVGVGWYGGCCFTCTPCRRGDFICCQNGKVTGVSFDGGYQESLLLPCQTYMVAPAEALAKIPDALSFVEAAPLMCAGVTVFNGMRHNAKRAGSLVAVQGIGGLGHLAIQYASKMGYTVAAVSRGTAKKEQAMSLGATHYIDSEAGDPAAALNALGGADMIVATSFSAKAMSALIGGMAVDGTLVVIGADHEPLMVPTIPILSSRQAVRGHPSGTSMDSQDAMDFAAVHGVRARTIVFPFSKTTEAYQAMLDGKYRVVLDMTLTS